MSGSGLYDPDGGRVRFFCAGLAEIDPATMAAVEGESARQERQIELIASENSVSRAVMAAKAVACGEALQPSFPLYR